MKNALITGKTNQGKKSSFRMCLGLITLVPKWPRVYKNGIV
jgi:hypothetical protein